MLVKPKPVCYKYSEKRMLRRKKDRMAVDEFCSRIKYGLGRRLKAIKLFGSKLTDTDTPDSDIDLFIIVLKKTDEVEKTIMDTAFELDLKYSVYISPRIVSQSVLKNQVWKNTPFIKNIERQGIAL